MSNKRRISAPWTQFSVFIVAAGASLITFILLAGAVYKLAGMGTSASSGILSDDPRSIGVAKIVQVLFSITVFGLTGYTYARVTFRDSPLYHLGLRRASGNIFYLLAVFLLLFALPLEEWLGELNRHIPLFHWMVDSEKANDAQVLAFLKVRQPLDPVINLVIMAAIPAICEELCFRGALQRIMIQICKKPLAGVLVSAFLFSFIHFQFEGFLPRMFLGALLGAAYWFSGSLWVAIAAHFVYNATEILIAMYVPSAISDKAGMPVLWGVAGAILTIVLLYAMKKKSTTTYQSVYGSREDEFADFPG